MPNLSADLRALRSALQVSQEELATRLGVSFATVNRWESGKSRPQRAQREAIERLVEDSGIQAAEASASGEKGLQSARRRRGVGRSTVLGTKSMEQMLWDAACSIRGEKDAPKFKDYLLPLLFIKRLSDVFDDEVARLADQFGDREVALSIIEAEATEATDARKRVVRFYIPPDARWAVVSGREAFAWPEDRKPKTLGEQLTATTRAIVRHNPLLGGVIDVVDFNAVHHGERDVSDAALKGVVEAFSDPRYRLGLEDVEPDFLGRCYEYLLRKFAEGSGQSAGEFFTPTEVGFLMAEILRPHAGEACYDYCCGSFGLLIKLQLIGRRLDPLAKIPLRLYGQELTRESYAIACMNRIIHDMEGEVLRGDSMRNPKFRESDTRLRQFDVVVANPMWNQEFDAEAVEHDPFGRFEEQGGVPPTKKGDWAWLQHTLASLKESGRAAVVLDSGAVTRGSGSKNEDRERNIRRWFVENDYVDGVILLPDNLFYNTTAAGVIVVLRKQKPKERRGKIVLVNASRELAKGNPKNYLTTDGVRRIADAFVAAEDVPGLVKVITADDAVASDFNLSPSRFVTIGSASSFRPLEVIRSELRTLNAEGAAVQAELDRMLDLIGA